MEDEEFDFDIDDETQDAINGVMKPHVQDGEVFVSVTGVKEMIAAYADGVIEAAMNEQTCQHGVTMGGVILDNLDNIMNYCEYLNAGELVPDTIPDDIMGG